MTRICILLICLYSSLISFSQNEVEPYDSVLAKSLDADDLGMKSYMFVVLKTGSATIQDKVVLDSIFAGHFQNINSLSDSGYLVLGGPYRKNDMGYRGLFILDTDSEEQAKKWIERDPTVQSNYFKVEYIPWYGSAALPALLPIHRKISKQRPK